MNIAVLIAAACIMFGSHAKVNAPLAGDYVEARTASVFAGACHYNGELVTTGRDAVMAWQFNSGSWHNVDLSGVRVMAAVTSDANLGDASAARKCEFVIDAPASKAQADAALDAIVSRDGASLGKIVDVRRAAVSFEHEGRQYETGSAGFASLKLTGMPNDECCKQPNLVWYSPLAKLTWRKVGFTDDAAYIAGKISDPWERSDENGAFYGEFSY
jgi:hypothetical protein